MTQIQPLTIISILLVTLGLIMSIAAVVQMIRLDKSRLFREIELTTESISQKIDLILISSTPIASMQTIIVQDNIKKTIALKAVFERPPRSGTLTLTITAATFSSTEEALEIRRSMESTAALLQILGQYRNSSTVPPQSPNK